MNYTFYRIWGQAGKILNEGGGGRSGGHTKSFSPLCFVWERVPVVDVRDRMVPENKARKCRIYYNNFTRPLLDDVIWEVHVQCSSSLENSCGN